jgi:hypothetical protein
MTEVRLFAESYILEIVVVVVWILVSIVVASSARRQARSGLAWLLCAILLSPIIAHLLLLLVLPMVELSRVNDAELRRSIERNGS